MSHGSTTARRIIARPATGRSGTAARSLQLWPLPLCLRRSACLPITAHSIPQCWERSRSCQCRRRQRRVRPTCRSFSGPRTRRRQQHPRLYHRHASDQRLGRLERLRAHRQEHLPEPQPSQQHNLQTAIQRTQRSVFRPRRISIVLKFPTETSRFCRPIHIDLMLTTIALAARRSWRAKQKPPQSEGAACGGVGRLAFLGAARRVFWMAWGVVVGVVARRAWHPYPNV